MFLSKRAETWGRPEYAKQWAKEIGRGLFVHVAPYEDLKNIKSISGEICVSDFDRTPALFSRMPIALGALFRGEVSHYFPTDVGSITDEDELRQTLDVMSKEQVEKLKHIVPHSTDEGWLNPSEPGNKLVGFLVLGPETDPQYPKYLKQAEDLAKLNGVGVISMFGQPKRMEQVRKKQEPVISGEEETKYRQGPQFEEYAVEKNKHISKRASEEGNTLELSSISSDVPEEHTIYWTYVYEYGKDGGYNFATSKTLEEAKDEARYFAKDCKNWDEIVIFYGNENGAFFGLDAAFKATRTISKRATMERALNVGVSTSVRKYWRKYYSDHNVPNMALMPNNQLNQVISADFAKSKPIHRILLKSAEPAEFRKSSTWFYLAVYRGGQYDVIAIAPSIKEVPPETTKRRMTKEWLDTGWKGLLERQTRPGK